MPSAPHGPIARSLTLPAAVVSAPHLTNMKNTPTTSATKRRKLQTQSSQSPPPKWTPLPLSPSELSFPLTFPTGQTFRWKQTSLSPLHFTGPLGPHLITLAHRPTDNHLSYLIHSSPSPSLVTSSLLAFLNSRISLDDVWKEFSAADSRFAQLSVFLKGARVLRQDPLECLLQFLCSSNNNIARITKMVDYVSGLGRRLGSVGEVEFYEFPTLERISEVSETEFRAAGFGYRAKYIVETVKTLQSKPGGGVAWLKSLRESDLPDIIDALCTLPGVGAKVASCVALFSLDQHHAVPVDTHVWQIATRHLLPDIAGARMTPKLCTRVAEAFVNKYGKYAGWAQTMLFVADLPSQKAIIPSSFWTIKKNKIGDALKDEACSRE